MNDYRRALRVYPNAMTDANPKKSEADGYRTIFKSSSVLGGSQGITYLLGVIRTKALAYLLGPSGIGLLSLYSSIVGTVGTLTAMGIGESAVREVAVAHGSGDPERLYRIAKITRRACFVTGLFGMILCVVLASPLSTYSFGTNEYALAIAILGLTLLLGSITRAEMSLIQGTGRFMDLARMNIVTSALGFLPIVLIYMWWKESGIVPALLLSSIITLGVIYYYSRKVNIRDVYVSWRETFTGTRLLLALGVAFMFTGLVAAGKDMTVRSMITRSHGIEATGIFQSAWMISGLFVNFVLNAMGLDFYPRLTAMKDDRPLMVRTVNQQIEIGILLALPGVVATITCAPMVILILYTSKFYAASNLLAVFSCGVFFKVISYPLNTIQLAMGDARGFATIGILFAIFEGGLTILLLWGYGLIGAAMAYPLACILHVLVMAWVGRSSIGHRFNKNCAVLSIIAALFIICGLLIAFLMNGYAALGCGLVLSSVSALYCVRELAKRLGHEHRIIRAITKLPAMSFLLPE